MHVVGLFRTFSRLVPDACDLDIFLSRYQSCRLDAEAALLVDVSFDDLRGHPRRQRTVLSLLDQNRHHYLRIAPRRDAGEPSVISEFGASQTLACLVADDLCAAG